MKVPISKRKLSSQLSAVYLRAAILCAFYTMNLLRLFTCEGCKCFREGKCLCYSRKGGPRAYKDCPSCKCVVIAYIQAKRKHTQKIFYHLRTAHQNKCGCQFLCKLRSDGGSCQRIGAKGKSAFLFHEKCSSDYKKCEQMMLLEQNFKEFSNLVKENGKLQIPAKCVPFLGTKQRNYKEFAHLHAQCLEKREAVAVKTKLKLGWTTKITSNRMMEEDNSICSRSTTSSIKQNEENSSFVHLFADIPTENVQLETFEIIENVEVETNSQTNKSERFDVGKNIQRQRHIRSPSLFSQSIRVDAEDVSQNFGPSYDPPADLTDLLRRVMDGLNYKITDATTVKYP